MFRITIGIIVIIIAVLLLRGKIPHEKFKSNRWKTANLILEENWSLRWDMMNDLRNRYDLVGMNKTQIIELLGNPGDTSAKEFRYYLGYSKKGINTGSLLITFNENNIVISIKVWEG